MLGASRVIAIDHIPERLDMARELGNAEVLDYADDDVLGRLRQMTGGRGPDACIDAVGMEAHGGVDYLYDRAKQAMFLETDRPGVLRRAIMACRKGGTVSIPGVYGGFIDKVPMGAAFAKGLTLRMGQTHAPRYLRPLLNRIQGGEIDPSYVISHRFPLTEAPAAYNLFNRREEGCTKVVLKPS